jgi:hypothetical protein
MLKGVIFNLFNARKYPIAAEYTIEPPPLIANPTPLVS